MDYNTPEETGFDSELKALASRIYDEEQVPPAGFGRPWREHVLFTMMRGAAVTNTATTKADTLAFCEKIGRMEAQRFAMESEPCP